MTKREKEKQKRKKHKELVKRYRRAFTNGNAVRYLMAIMMPTGSLKSSTVFHATPV